MPGSDGDKTNPFHGDPVEKPGDTRLQLRLHHLREDIRIKEPGHCRDHIWLSSGNVTGL